MRVFINGSFISCERESRTFSVLVEEGGRIAHTGDSVPPEYSRAPVTDLGGVCALPAFGDAHIHFSNYALFCSTLDVRAAADFSALKTMLRGYAAAHPRAKVLPVYGLCRHTIAEGRLPTRNELDEMTALPAMIITVEGHGAVVNTPLLELFDGRLDDKDGADLERGWLWRQAYYDGVDFITGRVPVSDIVRGISIAGDRMARKGIGFFQAVEGVGYPGDLDVAMVRALRYGLPQVSQVFFQTLDVDRVRRAGLKTIGGCFACALDGAAGTQDAAVFEPYLNDPDNTGMLVYEQSTADDFCVRANRAGMQTAMHAIGDRAIEQLICALEAAQADLPRPCARHTLIHADMITEAQIKRAAALGAVVSNQPVFLNNPEEPLEYLRGILGARADRIMPNRSLLDAGIPVATGSDAPCGAVDPMLSVHNCVNHPDPAERVDVLTALKMHTLYPACAGFWENERGSLRCGLAADFVTLDADPTSVDPNEIRNIAVTGVYFGGKRYAGTPCGPLRMLLRAVAGKVRTPRRKDHADVDTEASSVI